jgi:hypothetical protein
VLYACRNRKAFADYVDINTFGKVPVEQRVKSKRRLDKLKAASINLGCVFSTTSQKHYDADALYMKIIDFILHVL